MAPHTADEDYEHGGGRIEEDIEEYSVAMSVNREDIQDKSLLKLSESALHLRESDKTSRYPRLPLQAPSHSRISVKSHEVEPTYQSWIENDTKATDDDADLSDKLIASLMLELKEIQYSRTVIIHGHHTLYA